MCCWCYRWKCCYLSFLSAFLSCSMLAFWCINWLLITCRYLAELLAERKNMGPFVQVLPHSARLLNQGLDRFYLFFWQLFLWYLIYNVLLIWSYLSFFLVTKLLTFYIYIYKIKHWKPWKMWCIRTSYIFGVNYFWAIQYKYL